MKAVDLQNGFVIGIYSAMSSLMVKEYVGVTGWEGSDVNGAGVVHMGPDLVTRHSQYSVCGSRPSPAWAYKVFF